MRKWVARHDEDGHLDDWAQSRSRAPQSSPTKTPDELETQILASRARLVANPRAQYGSLAIQWDLRRVGVEPIPPARTIERVLERAGVAQPRRRRPEHYQSKGVPYPARVRVLKEIWRKIPLRRHVAGTYWAIPPHEVPTDPAEISAWLFDQWEEVDRWIADHRTG